MTVGKHRDGKYEKYHSVDILGIRKTVLINPKTGERAEGYGWTFDQSDRDAHNTMRRKDSNDPDYSPGSSSSGSICYLTTACVRSMNLPDDCLELNVLRHFRDKILMQEPRGKKAVREYYRIAPEIVQAIEERDKAREIWQGIYRDIKYAISLIFLGDFEGAFKHYQQMTLKLRRQYLD
ncbi:MAG: CFI-box-CTERM domain-containing protein [Candidatus Pacearchaeota archaeon]